MYRVAYMSRSSRKMDDAELDQIRYTAARNNSKKDVTGILLYVADTFFQILEGPRHAVEEIYDRVHADARHDRVRMMFSGDVDERRFGDWSMGFCRLTDQDQIANEFFELSRAEFEERIPEEASEKLVTLMRSFAQTKLAPVAPELF